MGPRKCNISILKCTIGIRGKNRRVFPFIHDITLSDATKFNKLLKFYEKKVLPFYNISQLGLTPKEVVDNWAQIAQGAVFLKIFIFFFPNQHIIHNIFHITKNNFKKLLSIVCLWFRGHCACPKDGEVDLNPSCLARVAGLACLPLID